MTEDKEEDEGQTGPEEPFKDESGELEEIFYDVLMFYWYLLHDREAIHPTPVMQDLSEAAKEVAIETGGSWELIFLVKSGKQNPHSLRLNSRRLSRR